MILEHERKEALTMNSEVTDIRAALDYCKAHNIDLDIEVFDRTRTPITYENIPAFLKRYKVYVDIRFVNGKILENLSSTGLQSLACGLKVLDYRLRYLDDFPLEHNAMNIVSSLSTIYLK
jgi:hypothetical protein